MILNRFWWSKKVHRWWSWYQQETKPLAPRRRSFPSLEQFRIGTLASILSFVLLLLAPDQIILDRAMQQEESSFSSILINIYNFLLQIIFCPVLELVNSKLTAAEQVDQEQCMTISRHRSFQNIFCVTSVDKKPCHSGTDYSGTTIPSQPLKPQL